jgi:hypothetical protein
MDDAAFGPLGDSCQAPTRKKSSNPFIPKLKNYEQLADYFLQSGKIELETKARF